MLYSIQMTQFEASAQIAQVLQDYQCQFVEFTDKETNTPPMGIKVKAILSAAFEAEMHSPSTSLSILCSPTKIGSATRST